MSRVEHDLSRYREGVWNRGLFRFLKGIFPRLVAHARNRFVVWVARSRGACIGDCVTMPYSLAKKANSNLSIGDHTSIQTDLIDLRSVVSIGSYVIIGSGVEILTTSHSVDSSLWEHKHYGVEIHDYAWLATRAFVLPSCTKIGFGAVCAAGAVVASSVPDMAIFSGNPASLLRQRKSVHFELCVESLLGNDFLAYVAKK